MSNVDVLCIILCREAVQQFMDFIDSHCTSEDTVPVLIAHNGRRFDIPFLAMEFAREGFKIPANWHFMDTLMVAQKVIDRDNIQSLKLVSCSLHVHLTTALGKQNQTGPLGS